MKPLFILFIMSLLYLPVYALAQADNTQALWEKLQQGGYIVLMRHALAPGTGDPVHFKVDDCSTQRNLSKFGREQAKRIGEAFKKADVPVTQVFSSAWCRCKETAELAFGRYEILEMINSFWQNRSQGPVQTAQLHKKVAQPPPTGNAIFVTHFINIMELTGETTSSGEMVILQPNPPNSYTMVGKILVE